jgi:small-conductance mechanosensitive channel
VEQFSQFFDPELFTLGGTPVSVATVASLLLVIVVTFWVSRLGQRATERLLPLCGVTDTGSIAAGARLVHYIVLAVGISIVLQTLGIDLSGLFAAGALFAVGLGFATRNILENFFSGLILLTERAIKPGDVLLVEGRVVRVSNMGIRSTIVRTLDEEDLILPNSILVQGAVTNYTLRDTMYRLRTEVGVVYSSDMEAVRATLEKAAQAIPFRIAEREPRVLLMRFGSSSVDFDVSVWIEDPCCAQQLRSQLNTALWDALKEAGITIAFPQLDVHFDAPVVDSLRDLGRG